MFALRDDVKMLRSPGPIAVAPRGAHLAMLPNTWLTADSLLAQRILRVFTHSRRTSGYHNMVKATEACFGPLNPMILRH